MVSKAPSDTLYNTAYEDAMQRIESQLPGQVRRAKQVLAWITCAKRQLHKLELQHALGVELDESTLDPENCPHIKHLVSVCAGLVTVDEQSGIIRLVHCTTHDYFDSTKARWFPDAEREITAICTKYLSFDSFATGHCETDKEVEKRLAEHHLYNYAAHNWGLHARTANADDLVMSFLSKSEQVDAACQVLLARWILLKGVSYEYEGYCRRFQRGPALRLAAHFGLGRAVQILADGDSVNVKNSTGKSSLHLASAAGYFEVAKLLVEKDEDVEAVDHDGWTPLHMASSNGRLEVAKLLIQSGADTNAATNGRLTPLCVASYSGHLEAVKLLLQHGADSTRPAQTGLLPLHTSLRHGRIDIVRLLLNEDTESCLEDSFRRSRHFYAVCGGLEAFNLLHCREMHINKRDHYGCTLLSVAVRFGHEELMSQLLAIPDIDCTLMDNFGQSTLWWARKQGYIGIAERLLEHARERSQDLAETEVELGQSASFGGRSGFCDVCFANVSGSWYYCTDCYVGALCICLECRELGAHCLVETHILCSYEDRR